jgi:hypothetical protein
VVVVEEGKKEVGFGRGWRRGGGGLGGEMSRFGEGGLGQLLMGVV